MVRGSDAQSELSRNPWRKPGHKIGMHERLADNHEILQHRAPFGCGPRTRCLWIRTEFRPKLGRSRAREIRLSRDLEIQT
jgi:hypothetical protein